MKYKSIIKLILPAGVSFILLISLSGLYYLNEYSSQKDFNPLISPVNYTSELSYPESVSNHKIEVTLFPDRKILIAYHELTWINRTQYTASEVQFHLYPNAFKNIHSVYMQGRNQSLTDVSEIKFHKITVNKKKAELIYFQPEIPNSNDYTVAKIVLPEVVKPGDSVKFNFWYEVPVPKNTRKFGYASGRNFFFISQWYPKPGVFENGKWICSQYHPYTNFFADFGTYDITINVPDTYQIASTGGAKDPVLRKDGKRIYHIKQSGIHDFAWMATDEIIRHTELYKRLNGSDVEIISFIQPENVKYQKRFVDAIRNSLKFFEQYIGQYPYKNITLVDVPRTSLAGGMEYPTLITVGADLFSPLKTQQPEYITVHEFSHQYFYGILANNEVYEAWLDEGLATYITSKIMQKYYGNRVISFELFNYYPVYGLNFLSYNEIPLIYSLGYFFYPEGASSMARYLKSPQLYAITDTSYLLPDAFLYVNASYCKPELVLISLERYVGFNKMMEIFRGFYDKYRFNHPTGKDFLNIIQEKTDEDLTWFFRSLFYGSSVFDYKIKYVKSAAKPDTYEVYIERLGDGIFKQEIALYTTKDTLFRHWDGEERWKLIEFKTKNKVIGAEIDPSRKNVLDLDYSNNSYFIKNQYGGSLGLTFRWFFWMQNLLLILGSIA